MKLSSLVKQESSPSLVYAVEVDEMHFTPPTGLETVGLLWAGESSNSVADDLLDTGIGFQLSGIQVILEISPTDDVDPGYILPAAANAGFAVSLVPPSREEDLDAWVAQCARFAEAFLTIPSFSGSLFPVSGFLGYLVGEYFAGQTAATPDDPYVLSRFVDPCPVEWSDAAKAAMRTAMAEVAGGEDHLRDFLSAILIGLTNQVAMTVEEIARDQGRTK